MPWSARKFLGVSVCWDARIVRALMSAPALGTTTMVSTHYMMSIRLSSFAALFHDQGASSHWYFPMLHPQSPSKQAPTGQAEWHAGEHRAGQ